MFNFVVLSCLVSVAFAGIVHAPAHIAVAKQYVENHQSIVETPTVEHVGTKYHSYPSATSYQSQTQYHSKTLAEPVYAHGVQKTIVNTPVVKEYIETQPILAKTVSYSAPIAYSAYAHAAPVAYAHSAPVAYSSYPAAYSAYPAHSYAASYALPAASYVKQW